MLERLEKQMNTTDLTISTFHSFALSVLQDNVLDSGLSFSAGIISRANQLVDYTPTEDTVGAFAETAKSIINAVCAEWFNPTPSNQTCRFCDYADLCERKEAGGE